MTSLEDLAIKQGQQIEALEFLIRKVELEPVIEDLDYCIAKYGKNPTLESHRRVLVECWEKVNQPYKSDQE
jgi:hypothetical protein